MGLMGRTLMLGALLVIGVASSMLAPRRAATLVFFSTSAQVVPVLLLVLALEARVLSLPGVAASRGEAEQLGARDAARLTILTGAAVVITLFALLWAEFAAFDALVGGEAADGNSRAVVRGLAVGFGAVALLALSARRT